MAGKILSYEELKVRISRGDADAYQVVAVGPDGSTATGRFSLPFTTTELDNFVLRVGRMRREVRGYRSTNMEDAKRFGSELFNALVVGSVREVYKNALRVAEHNDQGLRLTLYLTDVPELMEVPWEYLFDRPRFLSQSIYTPVVRSLDLTAVRPARKLSLPLRILGMVSRPRGFESLDVGTEQDNLTEALGPLESQGLVEVHWLERATLKALHEAVSAIGDIHVLHFIGHGAFDRASQDGILVLENPYGDAHEVGGVELGSLLQDNRNLRLVVLNSCEGARSSHFDPFSGVASSLVEFGIPAVIGMQFEITDKAAITFAKGLYSALAHGLPVDAAVAQSRMAVFADGNDIEFGTPVLFLRTGDARLFDVEGSSTPTAHNTVDPLWAAATQAVNGHRWDEAIAALEVLLARSPGDQIVREQLTLARRQLELSLWSAQAREAIQRRDWDAAVSALEQIAAVDETYDDTPARLEYAKRAQRLRALVEEIIARHQNHEWQAVIAAGDELRRIEPEHLDPHGLIADARRQVADEDIADRYARGVRLLRAGQRQPASWLFSAIEHERPGYRDTTALLAAAQASRRWVVAESGADFTTITAALKAAAPGDQICVQPGVYDETLVVDQDVELLGQGSANEIIVQSVDTPVVTWRTQAGQISYLTIRGIADVAVRVEMETGAAALAIHRGEPTVRHCEISNTLGSGILVFAESNPTVRMNSIHDNSEYGVRILELGRGKFEDNDITSNGRSGLRVGSGADPTVSANRLHRNKAAGVYVERQGRGTFIDNEMMENAYSGALVEAAGDPTLRKNRIARNLCEGVLVEGGGGTFEMNEIESNVGSGVRVEVGGNPTFRANRIHENMNGGVTVSEDGKGLFEENSILANKRTGVQVDSGGDPTFRANSIHDNEFGGLLVCDRGRGTFEDNDLAGHGYHGVEVRTGGDPTLRSNQIHDNKQLGVFVSDRGQGTFENEDIAANAKGGVQVASEGAPFIRSSRIRDNMGTGLLIHDDGRGTFEDNEIARNAASGVSVWPRADPILRSNRIFENHSFGIRVSSGGLGTFESNDIARNRSHGVRVESEGSSTFRDNRIHENYRRGMSIDVKARAKLEGNVVDDKTSAGPVKPGASSRPFGYRSFAISALLAAGGGSWAVMLDRTAFHWYSVLPGLLALCELVRISVGSRSLTRPFGFRLCSVLLGGFAVWAFVYHGGLGWLSIFPGVLSLVCIVSMMEFPAFLGIVLFGGACYWTVWLDRDGFRWLSLIPGTGAVGLVLTLWIMYFWM